MKETSSKPWRRNLTNALPASAKSSATSKSKSPSKAVRAAPPKIVAGKTAKVGTPAKKHKETKAELALRLSIILTRFQEAMPDPRCELYHTSDFQLLLSVMLSAQTTDKSVNAAMREAYDGGLGPSEVVAMGEGAFLALIRRIGLAPTKAKRAVAIAEQLLAKHDGKVPASREALEALPGVGRKTANVVLAELFAEPTLAVDTHVFRVSQRLGLQDEKTPDACEERLMSLIDRSYLPRAHHWFILHGRYTCKAVKPMCGTCILNDVCPSARA